MRKGLVALGIIGVAVLLLLMFFSTRTTDSENCSPLLNTIANTPGIEIGSVDYEKYADLRIPPLPPSKALKRFQLEEGFRIEIVAYEPMVVDPVAMDIDADGRLWIVDMPSYMPVHDLGEWETAAMEQVPKGRVVILEDTNKDGVMDKKRVFMEELILPRSIKVLNDGILVAEPPHVWFIQDTTGDGKGDTRKSIFSEYGDPTSNNVEHMPNGLMWGIDNWLYSSHSNTESIRRINDQWVTRPFQTLGQWGFTQDDYGKLYSSHNTNPLQTHFVPHGYSERNPNFEVSTGKNVSIAPIDMWPAHVTGVNRGYRIGHEVREDGTLKRATATGGPVIYRGGQFGEEYIGNAFVPEPAGNLIKRYIISEDDKLIERTATHAYEGKEFLTSTDERFRPVNMYNAPDGSLYVIDMYRGLFQHARYLTEHLRQYVVENDLYRPYGTFGRIYRIVRDDQEINYSHELLSSKTPEELVDLLQHKNGWIRDQAHQLLVQCSSAMVISKLEQLAINNNVKPYERLHALWTLEGYSRDIYDEASLFNLANQALSDSHPRLRSSALRILEPEIARNSSDLLTRLEEMENTETSEFVKIQLLASLGESDDARALNLMAKILDQHFEDEHFQEIALTGVYLKEEQFADILRTSYGWDNELSETHDIILIKLAESEEAENGFERLTERHQQLFISGSQRYQICGACHGAQGQGINRVGPPLDGSEWVNMAPEPIVRIMLQGFEGGARERGEEISALMPGHSFMSDDDIAAVLTFIRNSWSNESSPIEADEVARIREETQDRNDPWAPEELRGLE